MALLSCVSVVRPDAFTTIFATRPQLVTLQCKSKCRHCSKVQGGALTVQVMGISDAYSPAWVVLMHGGMEERVAEMLLHLRTCHGRPCHKGAED